MILRSVPRLLLFNVAALGLSAQQLPAFRPPAVPLIAHDPYFSVWSVTDQLNGGATVHWTGKPNTLTGMVRVDGAAYQVMGKERGDVRTLNQTAVEVFPTRTVYSFAGAGIALELTFLTPALPEDLDVLSRPLTYIEWKATSTDSSQHDVSVYLDAAADLTVNTPDQAVAWSRYQLDGQPVLRIGSKDQPVLAKRGDDLRIDWGYLYLAADRFSGASLSGGMHADELSAFSAGGTLPDTDDFSGRAAPRRGSGLVLAAAIQLGKVGAASVSRYMMLAYDDEYSIEFFERKERPWWRRNGQTASDLIRSARRDHDSLKTRSEAFDKQLTDDLRHAGGEQYARLAALSYRQALAAQKLVADVDGTPMYFPKENFSNGCIATVDVIYPGAPLTLLLNPALLRAQLQPVMEYASMPRWPWPFAPHDLGTYPQANGQVYGGGERTEENQMPVEESGNMLILLAGLAHAEGNAGFAARYWPQITRWAEYLRQKGLDPENQLSTDDFAGHLAHNANLSIKAILALGSYGMLAEMTGHNAEAALYRRTAQEFASKWVTLAQEDDHFKLAFDQPGTWSQTYNLVWDSILGLKLFSPVIAKKEIAFVKTKMNAYGLPLDNRKAYTKLDWLIWTATLADNAADFEAIASPGYRFANDSATRVPLTDWYDTNSAKQQGFQARSVVGGVFIKMLADPAVWQRYASRKVPSAAGGR